MSRYIVKIKDRYFEWSTIVDAPVTYGMTLDEYKQYYQSEYGNWAMPELPNRLARVEEFGTSAYPNLPIEILIRGNRAGENETNLTVDEIYEKYCTEAVE